MHRDTHTHTHTLHKAREGGAVVADCAGEIEGKCDFTLFVLQSCCKNK